MNTDTEPRAMPGQPTLTNERSRTCSAIAAEVGVHIWAAVDDDDDDDGEEDPQAALQCPPNRANSPGALSTLYAVLAALFAACECVVSTTLAVFGCSGQWVRTPRAQDLLLREGVPLCSTSRATARHAAQRTFR